jgi:hypothetical protein
MVQARRRELLEVALTVPGPVGDPFDPRVVAVDVRVHCPSGRTWTQPAFWGQPHERRRDGARERWVPTAPAGFFARLSPAEVGRHEVEIVLTDPSGARVVQTFPMEVAPSAAAGFVRLAGEAPRHLAREDGSAVTPIGMNLCWWIGPDPSFQMDRVLARMAAAGMTWTRLWLTHFGEGLTPEWDAAHASGDFAGLGRYSLVALSRLDHFFGTAARLGIDVQLVLWQHAQLASPSHSAWADNPYNAARGGPCRSSADFFTDPEAVRLSGQRLRTLVARFGAFTSLFAWEIWNEMDLVMDAPLAVVAGWCADRARSIRTLDAHGHLVTTSQAFPPSLVPPIASVDAAYDLGQCHVYAEDLVDAVAREAAALVRLGKPALASEVGLGPAGELDRAHPDGRYLHDATWAALASGLAGGAMAWWWDSAIDARDWYGWQSGAARFVRAVAVHELGAPSAAVRVEGDPGARVLGRAGPSGAMAWIRAGATVPPGGAALVVEGLPEGTYRVEQWDTTSGQPVRAVTEQVAGNLRFALGSFDHDTAVTVRPSGDGGGAPSAG